MVEATNGHLGLAARDLHDLEARQAPEQLGDLGDAREANVLLGDNRRGVRRVEGALRALGGRDHRLGKHVFGVLVDGRWLFGRDGWRNGSCNGRRWRHRRAWLGGRGLRRWLFGLLVRGGGLRLLLLEPSLQAGDNGLNVVFVFGVRGEVAPVVVHRALEGALLGVGPGNVVEHVGVRHELVGSLQVADALFVFALGDALHPLLEVLAGLGARVGKDSARHKQRRDGQHAGYAARAPTVRCSTCPPKRHDARRTLHKKGASGSNPPN